LNREGDIERKRMRLFCILAQPSDERKETSRTVEEAFITRPEFTTERFSDGKILCIVGARQIQALCQIVSSIYEIQVGMRGQWNGQQAFFDLAPFRLHEATEVNRLANNVDDLIVQQRWRVERIPLLQPHGDQA
jgi:hypothetical protein